MPRALFVSYTFPPVGGAGVQRLTKWLKYLPALGWDASVLTAENPSVPVTDRSLAADVPAATRVVRARTLEPGYGLKSAVLSSGGSATTAGPTRRIKGLARRLANALLQPDPQILWGPHALGAGRRLLAGERHDVVVVTAPPFSALLIGARLAEGAGLPLVLDFRDEWGISSRFWENRPRDALSRGLQRRMQARVLRRAQAVLATTTRSEAELAAACRAAGSRARTACVYNGYDPADFGDRPARREPRTAYRLAYVGTLWALTDVRPLVGGMALLAREHPGAAARLELVIAGRRTPEQDEALRAAALRPGRVTTLDYLDHSEAVRLVQGADGLCLLLANAPDAARVMPAKLFEYMAARRPILAVVPPGEVRDLLEGHPAALVCDPGDPPSIAEALRREIARHESGLEPEWGGFDPSRYSRISQTGQLAGLLHDVVDSWRRRPSA